MKNSRLFFIIVPLAVLALGMIGYCGYLGQNGYEGLLSSLKLLKVELGGVTGNWFVEAARWLGIVFYFSLLYAIASAIFDAVRLFASVRRKDSVAVHGDSQMARFCAKSIHDGKHCVHSDNRESFRARKQIIWFEDDVKAMDFYDENRSLLANDEVYIALNTIPTDATNEAHIHFFNINENIAADYWGKHFVVEPKKIVMIGSGALAEEMLDQALLINVYSKIGKIKYHIIGNFDIYRAMHPQLSRAVDLTQDELTFSNAPWHSQMDEISSADRVILTGSAADNTEIARLLLNYGLNAELHLAAESDETRRFFENDNRTLVFGTLKETIGKDGEGLFQDGVHRDGKLFDAMYSLLSGVINDENKNVDSVFSTICSKTKQKFIDGNTEWSKHSGFIKRSNYLAAKHGAVKKCILQNTFEESGMEMSADEFIRSGVENAFKFWYAPENKAVVEELEEIEHLRWWRLYLLNNFTYNENVKREDRWRLRQNKNMKAYNELDEQTRRYDGIHYWLLALTAE